MTPDTTPRASVSIPDYTPGALSTFPAKLDSRDALFQVDNQIRARLLYSVEANSDVLILDSDPGFPDCGIVRLEREYVFYTQKIGTGQLAGLFRGFAETGESHHARNTEVALVVMADHHNVLRDAIWNLQRKVGVLTDPADRDGNLSQRVSFLYAKWWTPRALWFTRPTRGPAPLTVQFFSFSRGFPTSYLWNFGDGTTLSGGDEVRCPVHVYQEPGTYTVRLTVFTDRRGTNTAYKIGNVVVGAADDVGEPLVWVESFDPKTQAWRPGARGAAPLRVRFIDQTPGRPLARHWSFGDGDAQYVSADAFDLEAEHTFLNPGVYRASLFLQVSEERTMHFRVPQEIEVK